MTAKLRPWLILALIWAAYFHPLLLHPTQTLYSDYSDLLSEHLPARIFLVREWRESGELPLWNPYHFCGAPFVHDIQVGTFYPPYAVTLLFPESAAGAVMSWAIALHVLAAAAFMFLYARSHGLNDAGGLVAAVGFAFSAKWMTHLLLAGHTITVGLAWLPLVLLGYERFIRTGRVGGMLGGGVAFALLVLGTHPQWTFYAGLFVATWTVPAESSRLNLRRWLLGGIGIVLIAVLLCAVQLLPTLEASRQSSRTVGLAASQSLVAGFFSLIGMVGPSAAYDPPLSWEVRSLLSLFALAAAFAAPILARESGQWKRNVLIALLVFSFGGAVLLEGLPGFNLFRAASRMLVIAAFPAAFLAGSATHTLVESGWESAKVRILRRAVLFAVLLIALPSLAFALLQRKPGGPPMWPEFPLYWIAVAVGLALCAVAFTSGSLSVQARSRLWFAAFLLEVLSPTFRFVDTKPQAEIYPESDLVKFLNANADPAESRVIDIELGTLPTDRLAPLGIGSPQALTNRIAMPRGYNPLDVRHFREYLSFVMGNDEPVLSLGLVAQPIVPNLPRKEPALFDRMNVRYLVCFDDYLKPEYQQDPGHKLNGRWRTAAKFQDTRPVPALPRDRPDPLPRAIVLENLYFAENPRAFVVPQATAMPAGRELQALRGTDLRTTVLLTTAEPLPPNGTGSFRKAAIREYRPNRLAIDLAGGDGGFLVLADVWFPGWTCRVDGVEVPVHRANHAFRAVAIPAGAKEAVFTFEPRTYRIGWWVSAACLALVTVAGVLLFVPSKLFRSK